MYGAGDAGEMIVRDMLHTAFHGYKPVAFVDDNPAKVGTRIHGVKVLGTRQDIARVMARTKPDDVLIAMPRATPSTVRGIVRALEGFKLPIQTVPNLRDILDGKVTVSQIRTLSVEDLLERAPVGLDNAVTRLLIEGRRVLVTGAGGSIGSELCPSDRTAGAEESGAPRPVRERAARGHHRAERPPRGRRHGDGRHR